MADSKYEMIQYEGREVRQYADGSIRDERGRMVAPLPGQHVITQADASALRAKQAEARRAVVRAAANAAVERADFRAAYGGLAFLAEIINAAQRKATTIEDPKMIEAARFVIEAAGESEKGGGGDAVPLSEVRGFVRELAALARDVAAGSAAAALAAGRPAAEAEG